MQVETEGMIAESSRKHKRVALEMHFWEEYTVEWNFDSMTKQKRGFGYQ